MDDAEGHARGDTRVDGIAARREHARAGLRGERMTRGDHPVPAHHLRHGAAVGRCCTLVLHGVEAHAAYPSTGPKGSGSVVGAAARCNEAIRAERLGCEARAVLA
jgi:hypothetical protein